MLELKIQIRILQTLILIFKTKLPKISENTAKPVESTEMQEFELNFNPFKTLEDFNLRTDIFADLNIKNIED